MTKHVFPRLKDKRGGFLNFADYRNPGHRVGYAFIVFFLCFFSFVALFPILFLLFSSLKGYGEINDVHYTFFPKVWDWGRFVRIWQTVNFGRYYLNTFVYVLGAVVCAVLFNSILAYAIAILKPVGAKVIDKAIFLGYMIPAVLNIYPLIQEIQAVGLLNPDSESYAMYLSLWLGFGANAYYYMLFKDYFERLPKSLMEAGSMDGADRLQVFFRIVLPLSRPILGIVAIFAMTASYSDFLLPYLVLQNDKLKPLMVGIYNLGNTTTFKPEDFLMVLVFSTIPQIILFLIFQRQIMNAGASKGSKE